MALIDVPHLDLEDALEILALMARDGDERRAAWSQRWLQRAAAGQHEMVERRLEALPDERALDELRAIARQVRSARPATRIAQ